MAAVMKTLKINVPREPWYGDSIKFLLFEHKGIYYVSCLYNTVPVVFGPEQKDMIKFDDFVNFAYGNLYFGNLMKVGSGEEDPINHLIPTHTNFWSYIGVAEFIQTTAVTEIPKPVIVT